MALRGKKKKNGPAAEASSTPSSSKTGNLKALKPKHKIVKRSLDQNSARAKDSSGAQIQGKPNHKKNTYKSVKEKNAVNQTKDHKEKASQELNEEKSVKEKNAVNQTKDHEKKVSQELNKEKSVKEKNGQSDRKDKEELGGLIFMCNGKTKPDCFHYGVMGVPLSQKEHVMRIKPELKLFLYDFDLKLMYGIYKASSAGGMKLEPAAFGGAFPAQVRFKVHKDCFPLPESVFKRAIRDNYYDEKKHKFKTELTVMQVRKLMNLFQTAPSVQSNVHFIQAPPQPQLQAPPMPTFLAGEASEVRRELPRHATRETFLSDSHSLDGGRRYFLPSDHESGRLSREPVLPQREVATLQDKAGRLDPLFLTEKEYRAYGLSRERRTLTPSASFDRNAPMVDLYQKDHEREQLPRHAGPRHRETGQVHRGPLFLSEKDYRAYGLGQEPPAIIPHATVASSASTVNTYVKDPCYPHHYDSRSSDAYPLVPRREMTSLEPYPPVPRNETFLTKSDYQEKGSIDFSRRADEGGGLYSRYASNALSDYNEKYHHLGARRELASTSVSSRYSFMVHH